MHQGERALTDLNRAILLELDTMVQYLVVALQHQFFEFKLIFLYHTQEVLLSLFTGLVHIRPLRIGQHFIILISKV